MRKAPNRKDITNQKFNMLTVIQYEYTKNGKAYWRVKCDCGKEKILSYSEIAYDNTKSCGCLKNRKKHDMSRARIYRIYYGVLQRCNNPKGTAYKDYGGRGIKVCDEWLDKENGFLNFRDWAMAHGYSDDLTIDRIDVDGNYEPNNCRWVTTKEQQRNKRTNHYVEYNGKKYIVTDLATELNMSVNKLLARLKKGMSEDEFTNELSKKVSVKRISDNGDVKVYSSMIEASKDNNTYSSNICKVCNGERRKANGYMWEYC